MAFAERYDLRSEPGPQPVRDRQRRSAAFLAVLVVAAWAQRMVERQEDVVGLLLLAVAAVVFVTTVQRSSNGEAFLAPPPMPAPDNRGPLVANRRARALLWVCTAGFAGIAYLEFADNRLMSSPLMAWLLAIGCFLLNAVDRPRFSVIRRPVSASTALTLIAITLVAAFFLFFRLADVPYEMTSDHAEKLLDVKDVLDGKWSIFFQRNTGREPLQIYLTAAIVHWTGLPLGHMALKIGCALIGLLAAPFTFLLGRQLFGTSVGLLAAAFVAVSHWHPTLSRVGLRFPFAAACAVPALYFLFRALRTNRRADWLGGGLMVGVGLYGYMSMRVMPALFMLLILLHPGLGRISRFVRRHRTSEDGAEAHALPRGYWVNAFMAGLACLLVSLPMLRYMLDSPRMFWFRALTRVSSPEGALPAHAGSVFLNNIKNALLMFNYRGDVVWVTTVPGDPALDWMTGAFFVLGLAYLLWRMLAMSDRFSLYLVVSLLVLLVPSALNLAFPHENPSLSRSSTAAPLAMLVAALPLGVVGESLIRDWGRRGRQVAVGLGLLSVGITAVLTYQWYFVRYDAQYRAGAWNSREMAVAIAAFICRGGDMHHAYHIGYPFWVDTRAIAINAGDITWSNGITDVNQVRAHPDDPAAKLYLVHPSDAASLGLLQTLFPAGRASTYASKIPGKDFVVFEVPARR